MMQDIHNRTKGIFSKIVLSLVVVTFVLWGVQGFIMSRNIDNSVATVNGKEITVNDFQRRLHVVMNQIASRYDDETLNDPEFKNNLKRQLLQDVINNELVKQASDNLGLKIGDQQLRQEIEQIPAFQKDGVFSEELFMRYMEHENAQEMYANLENQIVERQLKSAFAIGSFALPNEVDKAIELFNEKRSVDYVQIKADQITPEIKPSAEAIQAFYNQQKENFAIPESVSLSYIALDAKSLKQKINVSKSDIETYYKENIVQYRQPERWRLSQIVIDKTDPKAQEISKEVQAKLKQGESFEKLAKNYSVDLITSQEGGDLGYLTEAMFTPEMKQAMKTLKVGQVSEPYLNKQGYVFLKVTQHEAAKEKPLSEVKNKIADDIRNQQVSKQFSVLSEQLANLTFSNPDTLEEAAKELNLPVKQTGFFTADKGVDPISDNKVVRRTAFSADVLEAGNNSDLIQVDSETAVVVRVREHKPKDYVALDKVKDRIYAILLQQEKRTEATKLAKDLVDKLEKKEPVEALFKKYKLAWKKVSDAKRNDNKIDLTLREDVFNVGINKPTQLVKPSGDAFVFVVKEIESGSLKNVSEPQRVVFNDRIKNRNGMLAYRMYENFLREQAKIKINFQNLANIH